MKREKNMKCQNCGKENPNSQSNCAYCYNKLPNENLNYQENNNNSQEEKIENISKKIGCFVTMIPTLIGSGLIIIACSIFVIVGVYIFLEDHLKTLTYHQTIATLKDFTDCTYEYDDEVEEYCVAIYKFQVEGVTYTVSPKNLSPRDQFEQNITAYYNPNNPSEAITHTKNLGGFLIFPIIILIIIIMNFSKQKNIAQQLTKEVITTINNKSE